MVLSSVSVDCRAPASTFQHSCAPLPHRSSHSIPLPAFHHTDTDDSYSDLTGNSSSEVESDAEEPPTFHLESDCDNTGRATKDDEVEDHSSQRTSLTRPSALSPSHSSSCATPRAIDQSPASFFASSSFASLLSTRAASIAPSSPTSCTSYSSSCSLPLYSPHSTCVKPRVFAWKLEEAAVLFWERKSVLTVSDTQLASRRTSDDAVRPARFVHHSRHTSL